MMRKSGIGRNAERQRNWVTAK